MAANMRFSGNAINGVILRERAIPPLAASQTNRAASPTRRTVSAAENRR
jgi:hypothetical protein